MGCPSINVILACQMPEMPLKNKSIGENCESSFSQSKLPLVFSNAHCKKCWLQVYVCLMLIRIHHVRLERALHRPIVLVF